jgi:hypothetical protein
VLSFKEEYIEFLQKFEIEFKDEYLFEWVVWGEESEGFKCL